MFSKYTENYSNFYIIEKSSGLFSKAIFIKLTFLENSYQSLLTYFHDYKKFTFIFVKQNKYVIIMIIYQIRKLRLVLLIEFTD